MSYRKLAKKYKISESTLYKHAKTNKWHEEKLRHRQRVVAKAVAAIEDEQVKRLTKILQVTDSILAKISRFVEKTDDDTLLFNKQELNFLTRSIKDIKEIQSVKSKIDLQEQQARIDKLRKDAENKSDAPQAITINIEGGESSWQE